MSGLRGILQYKTTVDERLRIFLESKRKFLSSIHPLGHDVTDKLMIFVTSGKTIRGSLVAYTFNKFYPTVPEPIYDAAAGIELIHAGLLIHDDIMDSDTLRRGLPTIHLQYSQTQTIDAAHFGTSMAINTADTCFFLGYELIPPQVTQLVSRELQAVAIAQMQDVTSGYSKKPFSVDEVTNLYRHKTARYTFSLPFTIGAILAGASQPTITRLEELGERLGMLYQIRDDELNILGNSKITGKSTGTDRLNGKQTLLSLLGPDKTRTYKATLVSDARQSIDQLPFSSSHKSELIDLLGFCSTRDK